MRYHLRTLLILVAVIPPILVAGLAPLRGIGVNPPRADTRFAHQPGAPQTGRPTARLTSCSVLRSNDFSIQTMDKDLGNIDDEPRCPICGNPPENKLREYTPAGSDRVVGIYYCCFTGFAYPPVNYSPAEDDGRDIQPTEELAATAWKDRQPEPSTRLDLRTKREVFLSLIKSGLSKVSQQKLLPITRLDISFDLTTGPVPHVGVTLDTHTDGEPHTGASEIYAVVYKRIREWAGTCGAAFDGETVTVVSGAGATEVYDEATLHEAVGEFFVDIILAVRDGGYLKDLPRGKACYLGVRAYDCPFGWPAYADRGPANMF